MTLGKTASLSAALGLFMLPASALTLECVVPQSNAGGGYITETYIFQQDEAQGTALVSDALILYFFDAPITAKITDDTSKKLVFSWNVQMTNSVGQQTKMMFRGTYFRQNGQLTVRATAGSGYSSSFEGRGTCRQI
jgi:hypothetical protein